MKKVLLILFCFTINLIFAQENVSPNINESDNPNATKTDRNDFNKPVLSKWALGVGVGGSYTLFDIYQDLINPVYSLNLRYSFGHVFSARVIGMYGIYSGKNESGVKKIYGFANDISQVGIHLVSNLSSINFRKRNPNLLFYGFTGFTLAFSNGITDKSIGADSTRITYLGTDYTIPLGIGVKYKLTNQFDFGMEAVLNMARSDNFDLYDPNPNLGFSDYFGSVTFNLGYNFTGQKRIQHIDWSNPVSTIYDDIVNKAKKDSEELKRDSDKDGIPDYLDLEAATKPGYKVDVKGVTLDSDADGIPDTEDTDPYGFNQMLSIYYPAETFKIKSSQNVLQFSDSVPEADFVTMSSEGYGLPIITFEPTKYDIHVEQYPLLQQIARIMTVDTSVFVAIIGHADNKRPDMTQLTIAQKRALAVKRQLSKIFEINPERIIVFSEQDAFVKKYKMQTEGLNRKAEFRLIRKQP